MCKSVKNGLLNFSIRDVYEVFLISCHEQSKTMYGMVLFHVTVLVKDNLSCYVASLKLLGTVV